MIGRSGERGSGITVLVARHDDDDDDMYIYIYICTFTYVLHASLPEVEHSGEGINGCHLRNAKIL